jgi:HK97 family phage prohead protease
MLYLRKNLSLSDVRLKMEGDSGRFSGYASVFGGEHVSGDIVVKGAFDYTLRTHGKPKMYLEHAWANPMMSGAAALPIGLFPVCKEDDHGLLVEGELTPGMTLSQEVKAAMKHGTLDGLSVGGFIKKGDYDETETGLVIRRWAHLKEISVCVDPDDPAARVDRASIKARGDLLAAIEEAETIREIESLLRDAAGLSKGAATALVARVKSIAAQGEPGPAEDTAMKHIVGRLQRLAVAEA